METSWFLCFQTQIRANRGVVIDGRHRNALVAEQSGEVIAIVKEELISWVDFLRGNHVAGLRDAAVAKRAVIMIDEMGQAVLILGACVNVGVSVEL